MYTIVELFERESTRIFRRPRFAAWVSMLLRSRCSRRPLEKVLEDYMPRITLGDVTAPLVITSSDISTGGVHVFKSGYLRDLGEPYTIDGDVLLSDAVLASYAAPLYFDPKRVGPYLLAKWRPLSQQSVHNSFDGGPVCLQEAGGTGESGVRRHGISTNLFSDRRCWGLLTGCGREKLVSYNMSLQSQASSNTAKRILKRRYLRLDPEIPMWDMDDTRHLASLKAFADRDFTHGSKAILDHIRRANS